MTQLRILLVDDNPGDRALAIRALRQEFSDLQVQEVLDQGGLNRALKDRNFDVVITDFQIRWTTGIDVLLAAKARDPNLPVIMFTNTGTEEIAVEAMKLGLDDYVLKRADRYLRLPGAVTRSLNLLRTRTQQETRLSELDQTLQTIQNISSRLLGDSRSNSTDFLTDLQQIQNTAQAARDLLQTLNVIYQDPAL